MRTNNYIIISKSNPQQKHLFGSGLNFVGRNDSIPILLVWACAGILIP